MRTRTWRFFVLVLVSLLAIAIAAPLASDYVTVGRWSQTPITPISTLAVGVTARVQGVITGPGPVAFGTNEWYSCGAYGACSYDWSWNDTAAFLVQDSSGVVLVTVSKWWMVIDGPHWARYNPDVHTTYYAPGDSVCIMGVLQQSSDGSRTLSAFIVSPSPNVPAPSPAVLGSLVVAAGGVGIVWLALAAVRIRRGQLHREATRALAPRPIDTTTYERDPRLSWQSNVRRLRKVPRGRKILAFAILVFIVTAFPLGFLLTAVFGLQHRQGDLDASFMFSLGWFAFVALLPAIVYLSPPKSPSAVAFSDQGFHLWYDSPYARHTRDTFVAWDEIVGFHEVRHGRSIHYWVMDLKDGEGRRLDELIPSVREDLMSEVARRQGWKTAPSPPGSAEGQQIAKRVAMDPSGIPCPKCSWMNSPQNAFCLNCGSPLR